MRYEEYCRIHSDSHLDPLVAWIDDPATTDDDFFAHIGPIPTLEDWEKARSDAKARGEEPPTILLT